MKEPSVYDHTKAILVAPFIVTVVIPFFILFFSKDIQVGWGFGLGSLLGICFVLVGLYLLITTIQSFAQIGNGTLVPWNAPQKLVIAGPYRHVRNPMISGVIFILLGETIFFGNIYLFAWCAFFWILQHINFLVYEEPNLLKRFGQEYQLYLENVPRWIPRLSPWNGKQKLN